MKIIVLQVPSIISDEEINEALQMVASLLPIPTISPEKVMLVNILSENDQKSLDPTKNIASKCDKILEMCVDPNKNNVVTVTNFWLNVNNQKITKGQLLEITKFPTAAKAYLKKRGAECFYNLFESALTYL